MNKLELWYPLDNWAVSQPFGVANPMYKANGIPLDVHNGIDAFCPTGTPVRAAHNGICTFAGEDGSAGVGIVIRTHDEREYKDSKAFFKTIYWHLRPGTLRVAGGDKVRVGDIIAESDNTGLSTGPHLHFGLKPVQQGEQEWEWFNLEQNNGTLGAIDPATYFNGYPAKQGAGLYRIIELLQNFFKGRTLQT